MSREKILTRTYIYTQNGQLCTSWVLYTELTGRESVSQQIRSTWVLSHPSLLPHTSYMYLALLLSVSICNCYCWLISYSHYTNLIVRLYICFNVYDSLELTNPSKSMLIYSLNRTQNPVSWIMCKEQHYNNVQLLACIHMSMLNNLEQNKQVVLTYASLTGSITQSILINQSINYTDE